MPESAFVDAIDEALGRFDPDDSAFKGLGSRDSLILKSAIRKVDAGEPIPLTDEERLAYDRYRHRILDADDREGPVFPAVMIVACEACERQMTPAQLEQHISNNWCLGKKVPSRVKPFEDDDVDEEVDNEFPDSEAIARTLNSYVAEVPTVGKGDILTCDKCDTEMASKRHLGQHKRHCDGRKALRERPNPSGGMTTFKVAAPPLDPAAIIIAECDRIKAMLLAQADKPHTQDGFLASESDRIKVRIDEGLAMLVACGPTDTTITNLICDLVLLRIAQK